MTRSGRMTKRDLLAYLLRQAGERGVTTGELLQAGIGSRYSARLMELRADGWVVSAERIRDGAWKYTLLSEPAGVTEPASTLDERPPSSSSRLLPQDAGSVTSAPRCALFDFDDAA